MGKLLSVLFMAAAAMAQADDLIPSGAVNLATTSGEKTSTYENMHTKYSLFNGVRDRWLGYKPNPATDYYPSETVTFATARPIVNAYRVYSATANNADWNQNRSATKWELYGSNDGGTTLTLLHAQTETMMWYVNGVKQMDYVDFAFDNTVAYSTFKFRVTESGGNGTYAAIDDVGLYCLERADTLTVEHNGFELGVPTPTYGATAGLEEGDQVTLNMADTRVVNATTSRRYELTGFTIKYSDGTVVKEGVPAELPYVYTHGRRAATVVWNWSDPLADFAKTRRVDMTVPENAADNEISDAKMDGSAMTYINTSGRASFGPQFLFDAVTNETNNSRWDPKATPPYYAQYVFRQNGEEVRKLVTGIGLRSTTRADRRLLGFDFMASNDGTTWTTLLSVPGPATIVTNVWDFANVTFYSRYRFVVTGADGTLEMHNLEFYNYRGDDVLEILGSPAYGQPDPDYGVIADLTQGATLTLTAPTTEVVVSEDEKSVCTGYTLTVEGSDPVSGTGTTYAYTHAGKGTAFTWNFSSTYRQRVSVNGAGSVDCDPAFFKASGETVTITATAASEEAPFLQWRGDVPAGQENSPTLTYTVDGPRSLVAVFAAPTHVSPSGDDANDGTTWATAVKTIARGWEICDGAGKLYLDEGEFSVTSGTITVTKQLQVIGKGPDKTVLVADGDGTILQVDNALASVSGLRVKGATLASGIGAGLILKAGVVTNCCFDTCSTAGSAGGAWLNGTGVLVGSVFTNCSATSLYGAALVNGGTFCRNLVVDCKNTPVRFMSAGTVEGCVFRGNRGTNGGAVSCSDNAIVFTNCVFDSNTASTDSGVVHYCPSTTTFVDCLFTNNYAGEWCGVGMHFYGKIRNSRLIGNGCGASKWGGVLCMENDANGVGAVLENSLVTQSVGGDGTIYGESPAVIRNCTVVSNHCTSCGALRTSGAVRNTIIAGNVSGADAVVSNWTGSAEKAVSCCIPDHDPAVLGEGSIAADPRFVDAENGDYTLKASSPCVNAGANSYVQSGELDLLGNPRIHVFGGKAKYDVVDIGCYESPYCLKPGLWILVH